MSTNEDSKKKRMNFTIGADIADEASRLSRLFPSVNWSQWISVALEAGVAYLSTAEKAISEGKISRVKDISLPFEISISTTNQAFRVLPEEWQSLCISESENLDMSKLTQLRRSSVLEDMEDNFDRVYYPYYLLGSDSDLEDNSESNEQDDYKIEEV